MRRTLPLLTLWSLLLAPAALAQGEKSDPAVWAPNDALAFVGIADTEKLWSDFQKTAGYALMKESEGGKGGGSLDLPQQFFKTFQERVAKALDVTPDQLKNPFKGPVALYLTAPAAKGEEPEPGLVASVGDAATMKKYYETAVRKLKAAADKHESVSAGAHSIDVFTKDKDAESADSAGDEEDEADEPENEFEGMLDKMFSAESMPPMLALCLTDDRVLAAPSADAVKAALRRNADSDDTLARTEDYKTLQRLFKPVGSAAMLVNLPRIFEIAKRDDEDFDKLYSALGLNGFRSVIGHLQMAGPEFDSKLEVLALVTGDRSGLCKILSMDNRDVAPLASTPADASIFMSLNVNMAKLIDEIERIVRQQDPDMADQMRASMEKMETPDGETMNLRKDVIDQLREPLAGFLSFSRPYGADSARMLLSLGHRNKAAIDKLFGMVPMFVPRDVRGTQVYDFMMGGVSLATTNDQFVAGSTAAVEASLQTASADGLGSDATFKRVAAQAPKEAWFTLYVDYRRFMGSLVGLAEVREKLEEAAQTGNPGAQMTLGMLGMFGEAMSAEHVDASKKLLKHYAPSIATIATTPEGIRFTQVQLKPDKE
ncbi:MAG: hypothetical protein AB7Q17_02915 [Phycisphaerae bacterium]